MDSIQVQRDSGTRKRKLAQRRGLADAELQLLAYARSLPSTGKEAGQIMCSPFGVNPRAVAEHRPPDGRDLAGDYIYLALGQDWQQAAPHLCNLSKDVCSTAGALHDAAREDMQILRRKLIQDITSTLVEKGQGRTPARRKRQAQRAEWELISPPAPVGLHATIRARCAPKQLCSVDWSFTVRGVTTFTRAPLSSFFCHHHCHS